ncbi:MAG: 3-dehydroquinate synthase [Oscillospiraceae bacterium]|nr:3-dehydroquinate synthase [Oscillospiraceae bacterium]
MRTVTVTAPSGQYPVRIGAGLLPSLGAEVRARTGASRCAMVSGENVFPLYGAAALHSLESAGLETAALVFPAGENTKSLPCYGKLLEFLAEKRFTRSDCVIAMGGGVTGDLAGFAAATYQRGLAFVQVPTTLLAAVDASVGGKTAVNLPAGKNQVGAFYQPALVLCDTDTLSTLPARELNAGYAEVIKYAVLGDALLFAVLESHGGELSAVIESCVRQKARLVAEDERDLGQRRLLNLGHTFGHAVEIHSGGSLLHGEAVAVGMAMICRAARKRGLLSERDCAAVLSLLREYSLPTETGFSAEELYDALLLDKKFYGGKLHLVVPRGIGRCEILPVTPAELRDWLEDGLT